MKIGYVRVSKQEQHETLQVDALKEAGCENWFLDVSTSVPDIFAALGISRATSYRYVKETEPPE